VGLLVPQSGTEVTEKYRRGVANRAAPATGLSRGSWFETNPRHGSVSSAYRLSQTF
jgi:hypothetical protein